jgi:hypothetical protein
MTRPSRPSPRCGSPESWGQFFNFIMAPGMNFCPWGWTFASGCDLLPLGRTFASRVNFLFGCELLLLGWTFASVRDFLLLGVNFEPLRVNFDP